MSCLAYPATGGRQPALAVAAKEWVHASQNDGGVVKTVSKTQIREGFLAIHAEKRERAKEPEGPKWDLLDIQAESWATTMTLRLQHLNRDVTQAALHKPQPQWVSMVLAATTPANVTEEEDDADYADKGEEGEEEEEEYEAVSEEDEGGGPTWLVDFQPDTGKAFRILATDSKNTQAMGFEL